MRDFGTKKNSQHDPKRTFIDVKDNFPVESRVGELTIYKSTDGSIGLYIYAGGGKWDKIQTIDSTILPMGSDFPIARPGTLFYNNRADDDELPDTEQQYGLYYTNDQSQFVRILDSSHTEADDPHNQYMQVNEAISRFQPLKLAQSMTATMQSKMLPNEFMPINGLDRPMPIGSGMYHFRALLILEDPSVVMDVITNFGHEVLNVQYTQNGQHIEVVGYVNIRTDSNIIPNFKMKCNNESGYKPSSIRLLPNTHVTFDLMY